MDEQEKKQLVVAVITQLKSEGTDVSNANIVSNANGIDYVVAYGKNGQIVRAVPTAISSEKVGATGYMNAYTEAGVYNINAVGGEDLPIDNQGAISARMTVLVTESDGNNVITQVLNLNNNVGCEGNVYIRSCQNGEWKAWGKLQTNIEVGQVNTLDNLTDNGIYSGVLTDGTPTSAGTFYDTFVLIVINNYAVSIPTGNPQSISQLKYSLGLDGSISVASRKRDQYGYWDNWASLDEKSLVKEEKTRAERAEQTINDKLDEEIDRSVAADQDLLSSIDEEARRATEAEGEINQNTIAADSLGCSTTTDDISLEFETLDGKSHGSITFPAATAESAGVMSAKDKKTLDDITSSQFINSTYMYNNELSSLSEDWFIKSDLDFEVIEGAYIRSDGQIIKGDFGNIIIIKPKSSTQYIHIKSILRGSGTCFLGYANTVSAATVKPLIFTTTNTIESINANWYIKPVTYLYVYVGKGTPTLESIDGFNAVPIPTVEQVSDITSDISSIFETLPLLQDVLPFTYNNGFIQASGKVMIDNSFNNSLAVFDLEGISRVKIKVKAVIGENYTTATFSNTITPTSSSTFSPIIKTPAEIVTEIITDVVNRYLFIYVGNNASGVSGLEVSKISIAPTELVSKNELQEVEYNITSALTKKVDKKLGGNLFDKDSSDILYDTLLSPKNVTSQPDYARNFCVTPYIAIEEGKNYIANYSSDDNSINLCVVDATRSTVLLSINKTTGPEYKFTAPEGAAYVRMTLPMRLKDTFIFNEGTEVLLDAYYEDKPVFHSEYNPSNAMPWKDKTIAMYGDSITELCGNDAVNATSWAGYLISTLYAKGVVRGWGGTPLHHSIWDNSTAGINKHWFNSVGEKVAVGTEGAIQCDPVGMCDWKRIITQFPATIKDSIDAVILMGGTNDFRSTEIGDTEYIVRDTLPESTTNIDVDWFNSEYYSGGDFDVSKIQGAVCSAILKLQTWMPNAVIIVATQLSGYWLKQGENGTHQLVSDKSGLTEGEFALKIAEAARYMSVPVIDINGLTGINQWNRTRFITDNVHPYSAAGKKAMARVFIGEMSRIRPNF